MRFQRLPLPRVHIWNSISSGVKMLHVGHKLFTLLSWQSEWSLMKKRRPLVRSIYLQVLLKLLPLSEGATGDPFITQGKIPRLSLCLLKLQPSRSPGRKWAAPFLITTTMTTVKVQFCEHFPRSLKDSHSWDNYSLIDKDRKPLTEFSHYFCHPWPFSPVVSGSNCRTFVCAKKKLKVMVFVARSPAAEAFDRDSCLLQPKSDRPPPLSKELWNCQFRSFLEFTPNCQQCPRVGKSIPKDPLW